jgi:hypothetical protein
MRALWPCVAALFLVAPCAAAEKKYDIPYSMTTAKHILVRAKINGKGPFNFILDTGAPVLFVSTKVCRRLDIEPDKKGWGVFDRFEMEGGATVMKIKGRVEDPFQLEGMNAMGLAGVELHGVIGYNVLARYRMEIDFTRDKMTWTELDYEPAQPVGLDGARSGTPEMNAMGGLAKGLSSLLGKRPAPELTPRGFLGLDLEDGGGKATVTAVLQNGPAAKAGLKVGDHVTHVNGEKVETGAAVRKLAEKLTAGQKLKLTVQRGGDTHEITVAAGEGL